MEKLILKNKTEITIEPGASLGIIETAVQDYLSLTELAACLTQDNLSHVQFVSGDIVTGVYDDMTLCEPHFAVTKQDDGTLQVIFGLRELTSQERSQESIQAAITYLTDEQALTVQELYQEWSPARNYKAGDRHRYNSVLYKCLQDHQGQADWKPDAAPSLWARVLIAHPDTIPAWTQPDSTNAYNKGDRVTHAGKQWESLADNNVWEPGTAGTETLWKEIE